MAETFLPDYTGFVGTTSTEEAGGFTGSDSMH